MKALAGSASGVAQAPIEVCFAKLADIEAYPQWYPETVKRADVIARDASGQAEQVDATLLFAQGPLKFDQSVPLQVTLAHPSMVKLTRVPDATHDKEQLRVQWGLVASGPDRTEMTVELAANLNLPPFLPGLGSIANGVAQGFVDAAVRSLNGAA